MKSAYPVLFTKDKKDGGFLVEVPDLDVRTQGNDMNDAIYMARDIIGLTLVDMEDDGEAIPEPSDVSAIDPKKGEFFEYGKTIVSMVDIDTTAYRRKLDNTSIRRNITLPKWLDMAAREAKVNVSKVTQEALKQELGIA